MPFAMAQFSGPRQASRQQLPQAANHIPLGFITRHSHAFVARPLPSVLRRPVSPSSSSADAADPAPSVGSGWMDMPETQVGEGAPIEVFPRLKERDNYKRLGVSREASFEEVQDARNFLYEQYKGHEPSRESIELAFDAILQETMKARHKHGFKPPQRGKRGEAAGDAPKLSLWQEIRNRFESFVPATTIVNDGSIFLALGLWAAFQAVSSDPTLPLGAAVCFCAWKLYDKRNKREPDGPHLGGSPIWGALGTTVLALVVGGALSYVAVQVVPLPPQIGSECVAMLSIVLMLGFAAIFVK